MHLVVCSYAVRVEQVAVVYAQGPSRTVPWEIRTPDIPEGWAFEQATSRLDTGRALGRSARACVVVDRPLLELDTWQATSGADLTALTGDVGPIRLAARTSRTAMAEYRAAVRETCAPLIEAEVLAGRVEAARRVLMPILLSLGAYGLARALGLGDPGAIPIAIAAAGMSDDFTGDGDLHARAASGGTWYVAGASSTGVVTSGGVAERFGGPSSVHTAADDDGGDVGDMYAQAVPANALSVQGPMVRTADDSSQAYRLTCESTRSRIQRMTSGTGSGTIIANSGSGATLGVTARLEIEGDDLEGFSGATSEVTATDSTAGYETGGGGIAVFSDAKLDDFEWDELGGGGGTANPWYYYANQQAVRA